jgi:hypothetical protein
LRQPTANAMATKIYEERLKHPHLRDALDETAMKRPLLHGTAGNSTTPLQQAQSHPQQILASSQDNKNDVLSQKSRAPEPAMFGLPGTGHSKPAILSPGLSLLLLVHRPIPSCFNSCLNTNNSVFP